MEKMTVFYSKYTGEIKLASTGIVDFDIFCNNEMDMRSFCERIIIDRNDALQASHEFIVDLDNNIIKRKETVKNIQIKF